MLPEDRKATYERFSTILKEQGARPALAYLVSLTDFRFIGLWRFQNGRANAAVHFDRENPSVTYAQEVEETATFCCYVRDSKGVFTTAHALLDPRTEGHPKRQSVSAYCGVPVMDSEGQILGTLCHYDSVPKDPNQIDLELSIAVASLLAQSDHLPPFPQSESSAA